MKRQILVGVAFCSLCLNAYAFNPAAEKAQDAPTGVLQYPGYVK